MTVAAEETTAPPLLPSWGSSVDNAGPDGDTTRSPSTAQSQSSYYGGSSRSAKDGAINCQGFATRHDLTVTARGLVLAMVGLPGRGKSFISRKLEGFFKWQCLTTKSFNVGKYRRDQEGATESGRADFFDSSNKAASEARLQAANAAIEDMLSFLDTGGEVAIFDATNSTSDRRQLISDRVREANKGYSVIFVEVICNDKDVLQTNMLNKVRHSPDFAGLTEEEALADLAERVRKYEERYETIEDDSVSYIKLYNMSSKVLANRIYGRSAQSIVPYLMGIHIGTRPIWLTRTGQVPMGKKRDASLTARGNAFAEKLGEFVRKRMVAYYEGEVPVKPVKVMSSCMNSAVQTVLATLHSSTQTSSFNFRQASALNPIDRGCLDGPWWIDLCTDKPPFEELRQRDPDLYAKWQQNKLRTRFPGGESYYDVMTRVESCLLEIEMATRPVLCVSHITLIQVLLSYFQGIPLQEAWDISVPEHSVLEITPTLGGSFTVEVISFQEEILEAEEKCFSPPSRSTQQRKSVCTLRHIGSADAKVLAPDAADGGGAAALRPRCATDDDKEDTRRQHLASQGVL